MPIACTDPTIHPSPTRPPARRPSVLDGGPSPEPEVAHLGAALVRAAGPSATGGITYLRPGGDPLSESYADLLDRASRVLAGIRRRAGDLAPGTPVVLRVGYEPDLLAAMWACVLGGLVPVPLRVGGTAAERAGSLATLAGLGEMLGDALVVTARTPALGDPPPQTGEPLGLAELSAVTVGAPRALGDVEDLVDAPPDHRWVTPAPDDLAMLLLTSGSTGVPKAVRLSHRNVLARTAATAAVNHLTHEQRSFNWMPLDHVGGLVMFHVRDVYLRCTQVHAPMSWVLEDVLRWLAAMSAAASTITWAPNFAFGLVVDRAADLAGRDWDLSALGHLMNGGEPVKPQVARRFLQVLAPHGLAADAMYPGWGMSETSSGVVDCLFDARVPDRDERFVSVGRPHPGVRLRVVDDRGDVVEEGVVGRLHVAGGPITSGYHGNPEQNLLSFTPDGWFITGDLASICDGVLTVTGRADDVVDVGTVTYHGHEIETAVEELAVVAPSFTVACAVPDPVTGREVLAVFVHLRDGSGNGEVGVREAVESVRAVLRDRFGVREAYVVPVEADEVPKTGIGKLRRSRMRDRFLAGRRPTSAAIPGTT